MSFSFMLALIGFVFAAVMTPGPNNMMLLASGVNFGFRRTVPHMTGVIFGSMCLQLVVGAGVGALLVATPVAVTVLKVVGALYLTWLAWRLATSQSMTNGKVARVPLTFMAAAGFQWVNPKSWIMAVATMATFTSVGPYPVMVLVVVLTFIVVSTFSVSAWTVFGSSLRRVLAEPKRLRVFNITMALLLLASLWPMLK